MTADMRSVVSEETPPSVAPAAGRPNGIDGAPRPFPYGPPRLPVDGPPSPAGDDLDGTPPDAPTESAAEPVTTGERDTAPDRESGPDAVAGSGAAIPDRADGQQTHGERPDERWAGGERVGGEPVSGGPVDDEPVDGEPVSGELVDGEPVSGELVDGEPVSGGPVDTGPAGELVEEAPGGHGPVAEEVVAEEIVAAEVAAQLGTVVGDDVEADPAEFAAAAVLDVLRASGWADAAEAAELRAEATRTKELLTMVVRDHRAREASAAGSVNQQLHWLVPLLRAAHGVAFGSLGAKVALRTAVQDVPPDVLLQAGLRIDYGVEHAVTDEERQAPPLN